MAYTDSQLYYSKDKTQNFNTQAAADAWDKSHPITSSVGNTNGNVDTTNTSIVSEGAKTSTDYLSGFKESTTKPGSYYYGTGSETASTPYYTQQAIRQYKDLGQLPWMETPDEKAKRENEALGIGYTSMEQKVLNKVKENQAQIDFQAQQNAQKAETERQQLADTRAKMEAAKAGTNSSLLGGGNLPTSQSNIAAAGQITSNIDTQVKQAEDSVIQAQQYREEMLRRLKDAQDNDNESAAASYRQAIQQADANIAKAQSDLQDKQNTATSLATQASKAQSDITNANIGTFTTLLDKGVELDLPTLASISKQMNLPMDSVAGIYESYDKIRNDKTIDQTTKQVALKKANQELQDLQNGITTEAAKKMDYYLKQSQGKSEDEKKQLRTMLGINSTDDPDYKLKEAEATLKQLEANPSPTYGTSVYWDNEIKKANAQKTIAEAKKTMAEANGGSDFSITVGTTGNRPDRNNNPGNLRAGGTIDDKGFTIYSTPEEGFNAMVNDLTAKVSGTSKYSSKIQTLKDLISVYAPAGDSNDPNSYASIVAKQLGVSPDVNVSELTGRVPELAAVMAKHEGFTGTITFGTPLTSEQQLQVGQIYTSIYNKRAKPDPTLMKPIKDMIAGGSNATEILASLGSNTAAGKYISNNWKSTDTNTDGFVISSGNTLIGHLGELDQLSKAIDNGNIQLQNEILNRIKVVFGDPSVTSFDMARDLVAAEMAKFMKGGVASDPEIEKLTNDWKDSFSKSQLNKGITTAASMMKDKIQTSVNNYRKNTSPLGSSLEEGMKPDVTTVIYPESQTALKNMGIQLKINGVNDKTGTAIDPEKEMNKYAHPLIDVGKKYNLNTNNNQ